MTQIITTGTTKEGKTIEVVDLVPLALENGPKFEKIFRSSQKIYIKEFPKKEREPTSTVRGYVKEGGEAIKSGTIDEGVFSYLAAKLKNRNQSLGMASFDLIPSDEGVVSFVGYLAAQNRGDVGKILVDGIEKKLFLYSKETKLAPKAVFGEVEQPYDEKATNGKQDFVRNYLRPRFLHDVAGLGVAIILDEKENPYIVPYAQPGIKENGKTPDIVPMLPCIIPIINGHIKKIGVEAGSVISPEGKVIRSGIDKSFRMGIDDAYRIMEAVLECYKEGEDYSKRQCTNIENAIQSALNEAKGEKVYLIPIKDTKYLNFFGR